MLTTLVLVLACLVLLSLLGLCVLSPLRDQRTRDLLVPVAPIVGAGFVAVVTNWTCRWLSMTHSLPIVWALAVALLVWGVRRGTVRHLLSRVRVGRLLLGPAVALAGACVAAVPIAIVGDVNPVAASYSADQLYFAGVSTWMVDHPLLPGPVITDSWVGDSYPASGPAGETVRLKLRFGQSAVGAFLSASLGQAPMHTVAALSLVWLLLVGGAVTCVASALGARRLTAAAAGAAATSGFFVVSQALEGKNDGLLGASLALVVLAACWHELRHGGARVPLAFLVGALIATYSEYLVLLVPAVGLMTLLGARRDLLHRLNVVAWPWALSALVVPFAWVWMVQSFKVSSRFTDGPTPFLPRTGWGDLRAATGLVDVPGLVTEATVLAVLLAVAALVGWAAFVVLHPARGVLIGLLLSVAVLEVQAAMAGSGYLVYRVAQLSAPALVCFAVLGGGLLVQGRTRRSDPPADGTEPLHPVRKRVLGATGLSAVVVFAGCNLATAAMSTSHERAAEQHVPKSFTDELVRFVDEVGGDNVSVLAPKLTDAASMSLALSSEPEVQYPVIPPSTSYLGGEPLWDEEPDRFYVLGPGAHAIDGATTLVEEGGYRIVSVEDGGTVVVPFQTGGWPRLTWMRGMACARNGSLLLAFSNGEQPLLLDIASRFRDSSAVPVVVRTLRGDPVSTPGRPEVEDQWVRETVTTPGQQVRILRATIPPEWTTGGDATFVLAFADPFGELLGDEDPALQEYCLDVANDGSDGYERELTLMRGPS